jgi:putative membrane protein
MPLGRFTNSLKTSARVALICALLLLSQLSFARAAGGKLSSDDESFLKDAAQDGMAEVQFANLALQKSARPSVKKFAKRIVADHAKTNSKLKALAAAANIDLPDGPGLKNDAEKARFELLSGKDFDYSYVNAMVDDHKADVEKFQRAAAKTTDPELKHFISATLPVLKKHLQMIRTVQDNLLATNRKIDGNDR